MKHLISADHEVLFRHADDDIPIESFTWERVQAQKQALLNFWLLRGNDIDQDYPRLCFSMATDATLDNNLDQARLFLQVGIFLNAWCLLGQHALIQGLTSQDGHHPNVGKVYDDPLYNTRTDRC